MRKQAMNAIRNFDKVESENKIRVNTEAHIRS